jgi:FlaA1/EpsC-like NDP-sugar epimerase/lipopolysaccharide/colanic/teichoic acid biosynthesis glycosyltransferase
MDRVIGRQVIARDTRVRRIFDVAVAAVALAIASPVLGLAALYLKLALRGPVLSREARVGRGGGAFQLIRLTTAGGGRILDVLGIAAIPELINVLRGEMSFVGPRPVPPADASWYTPSEARLISVRPGLVSPAWRARTQQRVSRRDGRVEEREALAGDRLIELHYIQHRTVAADAWTIIRALGWLLIRPVGMLVRLTARVLPWVAADTLIAAASFLVAYFLRFLDTARPYGAANDINLIRDIAVASVGFALVNLCFRLHRRAWRYAAGVEVLPIAVAALLSASAVAALDVLHPGESVRPLPLSVVLVGSFFATVGFALFRYRSRIAPAISGLAKPTPSKGALPTRAVVYGAGELGQLLVRRLRSHVDGRRYRIVAFFDDDVRKHGLTVHGIKVVGGRHVLRTFVAKEKVDVIVMAMGSTTGIDMRDILARAQGTAAQIKVANDIVNWMGDRYSAALLRDMRAEDLIGRQATALDHDRCRDLVGGKTVLVTGACGSIGSELIRQILQLQPARILAVDMNESGLYDLAVEAKALRADAKLDIVVGDVTNRARMLELVASAHPEVIFHVAAYKHVPLMELYPQEAAWTNVWGTWVMADAAMHNGSGHFVLVSTDKAVNPSSIMGATKRMAELLLNVPRDTQGDGRAGAALRMTVVRFGNVLGSRGSVIPTFERQIELGGPVTITDSAMTRYFMHPEEAAALIVEAASLSSGDGVFMLDMGDRIRIEELAYKMIRLRGLRPNVDIAIEYTGLRPGEKLHEELIYGHEHRVDTAHRRVFQIRSQTFPSPFSGPLQRSVQGFASGEIDRQSFTAQLVAIAKEMVDVPQPAPQGASADHALVGRRHSGAVQEAAAAG